MRELKFRAWKKSEGRMLNWFELCSDPADAIDALNAYKYEAVMQYTGMKDKNGVEVYELMELDGKYRVLFKDGKYVLQHISTSDIIYALNKATIKAHELEITGEYSPV